MGGWIGGWVIQAVSYLVYSLGHVGIKMGGDGWMCGWVDRWMTWSVNYLVYSLGHVGIEVVYQVPSELVVVPG